jgi:hypothetical protein
MLSPNASVFVPSAMRVSPDTVSKCGKIDSMETPQETSKETPKIKVSFSEAIKTEPLTPEWWAYLREHGLTTSDSSESKDHGLSLKEIIEGLKCDEPETVRRAYFTVVHGRERIWRIDDNESQRELRELRSVDYRLWGVFGKLDRVVKIFGLAPVIYELNRIQSNYNYEYRNYAIYQREREFYSLCKEYNIETQLVRRRRTTEEDAWDKIGNSECSIM